MLLHLLYDRLDSSHTFTKYSPKKLLTYIYVCLPSLKNAADGNKSIKKVFKVGFIYAARLLYPPLIGAFSRPDTGEPSDWLPFEPLHVFSERHLIWAPMWAAPKWKIKFILPVAGSGARVAFFAAIAHNLCRCCSSTHLRDIIKRLPAATAVPGEAPKNVNVNVTCISIPFYFNSFFPLFLAKYIFVL